LENTATEIPSCPNADAVLAAPPPARNLTERVLTWGVTPGTGYCGSGPLRASTTSTPRQWTVAIGGSQFAWPTAPVSRNHFAMTSAMGFLAAPRSVGSQPVLPLACSRA